jgi:hypothetical protein
MSDRFKDFEARIAALGQHKGNKALQDAIRSQPEVARAFLTIGAIGAMMAFADQHAEALKVVEEGIQEFLDEAEGALNVLAAEDKGE